MGQDNATHLPIKLFAILAHHRLKRTTSSLWVLELHQQHTFIDMIHDTYFLNVVNALANALS